MMLSSTRSRNKFIIIAILSVCFFFTFFPFYFMIISSFKSNAQILRDYFLPSFPLILENYVKAFKKVIYYLLNSSLVSGGTAAGVAVLSSLSSYVFAKFIFPGKNFLFLLLLSFIMIPGVLTLIPSFVLVAKMNLVNNYLGCIFPYIAHGQITFILILRAYIEQIPQDLFDSAKIDGASHPKIFIQIVFPLTKPIMFSLLLLNILSSWNDFIWPLLVLSKENMKTVTVGLYAFTDVQQVQYGLMFAGFIIASIPLIILFSLNMRYFIKGVTAGAVKG